MSIICSYVSRVFVCGSTRNILVDVELIVSFTRLPLAGVDIAPLFIEKDEDTSLMNKMK